MTVICAPLEGEGTQALVLLQHSSRIVERLMRGVVLKGKPQQAAYFQSIRDLQEIPQCEVVSGRNHQLRVVERKKNLNKI